jgi:hypothetical protein
MSQAGAVIHKMKISVIMVDGGFRERISAAASFSRQDFPAAQYEIIWVEYFARAHGELQGLPRVRVITLNRDGPYHSSYCFNAGIRAAAGELLVIADGDVMVEEDFLSAVVEEHGRHDGLAMYFYRFCQEESLFKKEDVSLDYVRKTSRLLLADVENYGGCLTIRKKWLLAVNGYEQHRAFASGHHANGKDVYTRLKNLGLCVKWQPGKFLYHPWHPGTHGRGRDERRSKWQQEIIKYRGVNLMTTAFAGLADRCSAIYSPPPPPLGDPDL